MGIKMVVCDLDGTLIAKNEVIPAFIPEMIQALRARGIEFTIATGRTPNLTSKFIDQLGIEIPYVMANGAMIARNNVPLNSQRFQLAPLKELIQQADQLGMSIIFAGDDKDKVLRVTPWLAKQDEQFGRYNVDYYPTEEEWNAITIPKLTVWDKTYQIERISNELIAKHSNHCSITQYGSECLDIVPYGCNKWTGIQWIAEHLKVNLNEIMTIGDHYNDLEMISGAGTGVAIGTAPQLLHIEPTM